MSNEKQWTYNEYSSDRTYFVLRPDRRVFVHSLTESQAKEICDKFNTLDAATSRIAELEAQLRKTEAELEEYKTVYAHDKHGTNCNCAYLMSGQHHYNCPQYRFTPPQNTKG